MSDEPLFPAPEAAALFYDGHVMHARFKPVPHRFRYSVFSLLIDLDRLEEAGRLAWFFSIGRFNLLSFHPRDHGPQEKGDDPRRALDTLLDHAGLTEKPGRVLLLCYPRVFGFVFNPLSVYFIYAASGPLTSIVYEVRNTFGERHSYVAPIRDGELTAAGIRQSRDKLFYVSPFLDQPMRYHFRLRPPGADVALRIHETDKDGPILAAVFAGKAVPVTNRNVLRLSLLMPLMTLKVVLGIHFEAMRLWFKGIRFYSRPAPPPAVSHDGVFIPPIKDNHAQPS